MGYYVSYALWRSNGNLARQSAENDFKRAAAHEMGHLVLDKYGVHSDPDYSWSHKGTSTVITQKVSPVYPMPINGEIDLIKYIYGYADDNQLTLRSCSANEDVQALIWLARLSFND